MSCHTMILSSNNNKSVSIREDLVFLVKCVKEKFSVIWIFNVDEDKFSGRR